jgi:hypothetical protein
MKLPERGHSTECIKPVKKEEYLWDRVMNSDQVKKPLTMGYMWK